MAGLAGFLVHYGYWGACAWAFGFWGCRLGLAGLVGFGWVCWVSGVSGWFHLGGGGGSVCSRSQGVGGVFTFLIFGNLLRF